MLMFCVISSGSKGNCIYLEPDYDPDQGENEAKGLLLDYGMPVGKIIVGLANINRSLDYIRYRFASHLHKDHCNEKLYTASIMSEKHSFKLIHDEGAPCRGFFLKNKSGLKIAYVPDTVTVPCESLRYLIGLNTLIIEANWDQDLIEQKLDQIVDGNYSGRPPERLYRAMETHLSNQKMASVVETVAWDGLKHVVLVHLSSGNNTAELARQAAEQALNRAGCGAKVHVSVEGVSTGMIIGY